MSRLRKVIAITIVTAIMASIPTVSSSATQKVSSPENPVVILAETEINKTDDNGLIEGGDSIEDATTVELGKEYTTLGKDGWYKITTPQVVSAILLGCDSESKVEAYDEDENYLRALEYYEIYALGEKTLGWGTDENKEALQGNTEYYFHISTDSPSYSTFQILCEERYAENEKMIQLNTENSCRFLTYGWSAPYPADSWYKFVAPITGKYKLCLKTVEGGARTFIYQEQPGFYYAGALSVIETKSNRTSKQQVDACMELIQGRTYYVRVLSLKAGVTATVKVLNRKVDTITLNKSSVILKKGQQFTLTQSITPEDVVDSSVTYTSSNPKIAIVTDDGIITAVNSGTAIIKCKANDGGNATAKCIVKVNSSATNNIKTGSKITIGDIVYKVTAGNDKYETCEVSVLKVNTKTKKSYTIPNTVKINGETCKVTSIASNAFSGCTKATKITIGKNIQKIGSKAFYNCKNLKTLTINSTKVKSVGTNALKNVYSKAKIKVPSSKLKSYQKLFAKKGQKSTVKITKK